MSVGARWLFAAVTVSVLQASTVSAQGTTGRVTGRVVETSSQGPLANVSVTVVGTTLGAYSRPDGGYLLPAVPAGAYKLRVARIGYVAKEVSINVVAGQATTADVSLDAVAAQLAGVVTVGYGTREARDRTGVVETVTEKTFNTGRIVSPEQLIQAKVPGVQVVDNNEPGGGISLRIRGASSINASSEPLFVVDGVPLQVGGGVSAGRNPLNFLNPADIESMSVLKDASATAIYGSRGSNGVVIITTKSGSQGTKVTYGSSYSNSRVAKEPTFLDAAQYRAAVAQYAPENVSKLGSASTNWREAVQRAAPGIEHNMAVSGGKDAMRYRLSLNYLDQDGVIQGTSASRIASNFNYSDRLFEDRLEVKTSLKGSRTSDEFTPGGVLGSATAFAPTQPLRNANGTFFQWADPLGANNPLSDLALISDRGNTFRSIGNIETRYRIPRLDGLSATVRAGYDFAQSTRTTFQPSTAQNQLERANGGRFDRNQPRQVNTVLEIFGNYARRVESMKSDLDLTAGYTYEESNGDYPSFYAENLSSDLLGPNGIPAARTQQNFFNVQESKLISTFARANYRINDRYLFEVGVRRDGSSRFGPGNQFGVFPSASAAWRVIDEPFLKDKLPFSDLKVRYSWGVNGNQSFGNYLFVSTYTPSGSQAQVQFGDTFVSTIRPSAVDPSIKWEETTSNNLGLDFGFKNNRFTGTIDYYKKTTNDLIFRVPVAAGTNLADRVTTNIGSMENTGLEIGLNARLIDPSREGAFSWEANVAAANNSNKLIKINTNAGNSNIILTGDISGGVGNQIQVLQPGKPINSFYVYRSKKGADGKPVGGDKEDKDLYEDLNGDGTINEKDREAFQSPAPKWIIGHTSNMAYRNFDLALTVRAYLGNYVYNNVASNLGNYALAKGNAPGAIHASVLDYGFTKAQYLSDVYVEDASFVRLDNITVGYNFRKLRGFENVRLFGTVQNVFTSSKYSGVDPLAGINGIDNNIYPLSRTFTTGLNIGF
ncbi:MAG: SusC/RagA family TonB-linked outer membrane protein [Gemmatimonadaceae bacterium]|nr:SusC/RagA family TonB-linked outer membrane protein [Gemmatimonadaceae bacterium]